MHTVLSSTQHLVFFLIFIQMLAESSLKEFEMNEGKKKTPFLANQRSFSCSWITAFSFNSCSLMKIVLDVVDGR